MQRIVEPGLVAPGLRLVGNAAISLWLLDGAGRPSLVDSGMTILGPLLAADLDAHAADGLDRVLLTHSHYDHVSGLPLLKRRQPDLAVAAHPLVGEVLARPNAVSLVRRLNASVVGGVLPDDPNIVEFAPFVVDRPLSGGEVIDLGAGREVHVLATPGHTRDSLSFYLPWAKAIIPGEAAGVPGYDGTILPEFLQSFAEYRASLLRMAALDLEIICLPHGGALVGDDARSYMRRSLDATDAFRLHLRAALNQADGDVEAAWAAQMDALYGPNIGQPRDAFGINLRAMLTVIAEG